MNKFRPQGQRLLLSAILMSLTVAAQAEAPQLSYSLGAASDYVFRGVSQTNEDPLYVDFALPTASDRKPSGGRHRPEACVGAVVF